MRLCGESKIEDKNKGMRAIHSALDNGFIRFDHADIYGNGHCETLSGQLLSYQPHRRLSEEFTRQANSYDIQPWQVALLLQLKHPVPIISSITSAPIATSTLAFDYSREDWYRLLEARNGVPVP